MFHLKVLTKDTHPTAQDIKREITSHPTRKYTAELDGYNFPAAQVKQLIKDKCGVCVKKSDGFSRFKIQEFIKIGKQSVILLPKDFSERDCSKLLEKGATAIVSLKDGFDVLQIKKLISKGKENAFVLGGDFLKSHIADFLKLGGSVLLKKGDLNAFEITHILPFGEERIHIQSGGFTDFRIDIFLEGKANLIIGKGCLLSQPMIKDKVKKYKSQIYIDSDHFKFDLAWVKKMENLGAMII